MEEFKEILEKVCKKVGAEFRFIHYKGTGTGNEMWLRGWLLHPDTAKAIWGEGEKFDSKIFTWQFDGVASKLCRWQYHNAIVANMQSNSEILRYMSKYLL